jgi:hypothetical protein
MDCFTFADATVGSINYFYLSFALPCAAFCGRDGSKMEHGHPWRTYQMAASLLLKVQSDASDGTDMTMSSIRRI